MIHPITDVDRSEAGTVKELIRIIMVILFIAISVISAAGYYGEYGEYGGYGGGSGGIISSVDPISNIAMYETKDGNLIANQLIEYSFSSPELSIYNVLINGKQNEYYVSVRIESLKDKSIHAKIDPPGIVYRNENMLISNRRINYYVVKFRVKNSWIEENQLDDKRHPFLLKWNGTSWLVLKTDIIGKDEEYTYFESPKAGQSSVAIFAISAPPKRAPWPTPIEEGYEERPMVISCYKISAKNMTDVS